MPWKKVEDNSIAPIGEMFTYKNKKYPPTWDTWSSEYKVQMGLVWEDDPTPVKSYDNIFYKGVNSDGSLIEKDIDEVKKYWVQQIKVRCSSYLKDTDWYAIRKADAGTAIPSNITKYRTDTRTACKTIEDKINGCSKISDIEKLLVSPDTTTEVNGVVRPDPAPMYDFPIFEDY